MGKPRVLSEEEQLSQEREKALELIGLLLDGHLKHACKCREEEVYKVSVALTIERNAHNSLVRAKISYSKRTAETVEGSTRYEQPSFEGLGDEP